MRVFTVTQSMRGGSLPIRGGREQRRTRGSNSLCSDDIHWSSQLVASASRVLRSASETPPVWAGDCRDPVTINCADYAPGSFCGLRRQRTTNVCT